MDIFIISTKVGFLQLFILGYVVNIFTLFFDLIDKQ